MVRGVGDYEVPVERRPPIHQLASKKRWMADEMEERRDEDEEGDDDEDDDDGGLDGLLAVCHQSIPITIIINYCNTLFLLLRHKIIQADSLITAVHWLRHYPPQEITVA